uniref:Peptidase A1 domain-containing protein n=1 Tax=Aegilops tauschii subsp. strangulata TaxID=200361 RepID=A0A453SJW2_AEGTS
KKRLTLWDGGSSSFVQTLHLMFNNLFSDLAFSNRLVLYDLENQVIGWTDYNCSSSIKIKDDKTGSIYTVNAHDISSGWRFQWHKPLFVLLVTALCSYTMF